VLSQMLCQLDPQLQMLRYSLWSGLHNPTMVSTVQPFRRHSFAAMLTHNLLERVYLYNK
jgi:hypothetical protein